MNIFAILIHRRVTIRLGNTFNAQHLNEWNLFAFYFQSFKGFRMCFFTMSIPFSAWKWGHWGRWEIPIDWNAQGPRRAFPRWKRLYGCVGLKPIYWDPGFCRQNGWKKTWFISFIIFKQIHFLDNLETSGGEYSWSKNWSTWINHVNVFIWNGKFEADDTEEEDTLGHND